MFLFAKSQFPNLFFELHDPPNSKDPTHLISGDVVESVLLLVHPALLWQQVETVALDCPTSLQGGHCDIYN